MFAPDPKTYERQYDRHAIRPLDSTLRAFPEALASYIKATKPGEDDRKRTAVAHYAGLPFPDKCAVLDALARTE